MKATLSFSKCISGSNALRGPTRQLAPATRLVHRRQASGLHSLRATATEVVSSVDFPTSTMARIASELLAASDVTARSRIILEYAQAAPAVPAELRTDANRVMGCTAQVWLSAKLGADGKVTLYTDSDAALTKGLGAILAQSLSGLSPEEILEVEPECLLNLGLSEAVLTRSRTNGFLNMLEAIKKHARTFLGELPQFPSLVISSSSTSASGAFAEAQDAFLRPNQATVDALADVLSRKKIGVVAHFYMDPEVQGVLSSAAEKWPHIKISDSLVMADGAVKMVEAGCETIVVLGVDFMSENVRAILDEAGHTNVGVYRMASDVIGCSLAEAAESPAYEKYLDQAGATPNSLHVVYINTSLKTKALANEVVPTITCTSSNVVQTVLQAFAQVPEGNVWYGPDTYMGRNLAQLFTSLAAASEEAVKELHPDHTPATIAALLPRLRYFDQGTCIVHHLFGGEVCKLVREGYSDAYIAAHFEVPGEMFTLAMEARTRGMGVVGSTQNILDFISARLGEALDRPFPEKLKFVLGTEAGMITSIVRKVQSMLQAAGRDDVQVEIVFPVSLDAITTDKQTTADGKQATLPGGLSVVPGPASGEGCSLEGGCASCPYMKMNSLDALMRVCERVGDSAAEATLEGFKPRPYTELVGGKTMAQAGCVPILHMRGFQTGKKLPDALDDLLALKTKYPDLKLKKTSPPLPTAPFPIILSKVIEAPPQASYIDIDYLTLKATITFAANEPSEAPNLSSASEAASVQPTVSLDIVSSDLPGPLKGAITLELYKIRDAAPDDGSLLRLGPVFAALRADFAWFVCLLPEWTERYETVDAEGRTLRRVAILSDEASVSIEAAAVVPTSPPANKAAEVQRQLLPRALQAELEALKKRYKVTMVDTSIVDIAAATEVMQQLELTSKQGSSASGSVTAHGHNLLDFVVELHPTDPQWTPPGSALLLECSVLDPASYPSRDSFKVTLQPSGPTAATSPTTVSTLSEQEAAVFNKLLEIEAAGAAGHPDALRAVLRRCENNAGDLLHQAADMAMEIQRRRAAAAENNNNSTSLPFLRDRPSFEKERTDHKEESATESDDSDHWDDVEYSHSEEEDEHSREDEEEEEHALLEQHPGGNSSSAERLVHNVLHLTLESLQMVEIDTLDMLKLRLQVACTRCKASGEASFLQDGSTSGTSKGRKNLQWAGECSTCHAQWSITVAPRIVHEDSNVLAVVRAEGCGFQDLLPSMVSAQCSACSNLAAFREVQIGKWNERNCSHCHRRMAFIIPSVAFVPPRIRKEESAMGKGAVGAAKRSTAGGGGSGSSKSRSDRDFVITPGQPLPNNGACKHYRHSYRWLRFPCCGRRYACDLCHEEGADHEMKWAVRMVCGFCSTEQSLGETCKSCGKKVATSAARPSGRNTSFWEGGEGQRDQKRLSKRDPHKWRNSKLKTKSRKDQRVGQKGKEKTEKTSGK